MLSPPSSKEGNFWEKPMKLHSYILILLVFSSSLFAGVKFYQVILSNGEKLSEVYIRELAGDSLSIGTGGEIRLLAVDDIVEIFRSNKSAVARNGALGVLLGCTAGFIIGAATWDEIDAEGVYPNRGARALTYGMAGTLAGGIIGTITTPKYERYSFSNKTKEEKIKILEEKILSNR